MIRKKLMSVLGLLLTLVILLGLVSVPITVLAQENEYVFLNPMGVVEPRADTPLADRQGVIDILNGEGTRTLRLGITWYYKPLDGEQAVVLGRLLKAKWEAEYGPGLTVQLITPDPNQSASYYSMLPGENSGYIPYMGHAWNIKAECVYDFFKRKCDAMIIGTGD